MEERRGGKGREEGWEEDKRDWSKIRGQEGRKEGSEEGIK